MQKYPTKRVNIKFPDGEGSCNNELKNESLEILNFRLLMHISFLMILKNIYSSDDISMYGESWLIIPWMGDTRKCIAFKSFSAYLTTSLREALYGQF